MENSSFFENIFDNLKDAIYVLDEKGNMIFVNSAMIKNFNSTREEMLTFNTYQMYQDGMIDYCISKEVFETKKETVMCQNIVSKQGPSMRMTTQVPIFNGKGDIVYVVGIMRDMGYHNEQYQAAIKKHSGNILWEKSSSKLKDDLLVYESSVIQHIIDALQNVVGTDATILLQGESGTGKEVFANYIHQNSPYKINDMVKINCASLPESLLESELFGYERGAFTGALSSGKKGLIETAEGSTLFLDEINSMPLAIQGKLLRVLETKMVNKIGSNVPQKVNFRLLAASNENLSYCVQNKTFRADLYYRLNVIAITIPPLRDRKRDIPVLLNHFLDYFCKKYRKEKVFSEKVVQELMNYQWPGNIRELRNFVERITLMSGSDILIHFLPPGILEGTFGHSEAVYYDGLFIEDPEHWQEDAHPAVIPENMGTLAEAMEQHEKKILMNAIKRYGSANKAAKALGINQSTISRKLLRYNLNSKSKKFS